MEGRSQEILIRYLPSTTLPSFVTTIIRAAACQLYFDNHKLVSGLIWGERRLAGDDLHLLTAIRRSRLALGSRAAPVTELIVKRVMMATMVVVWYCIFETVNKGNGARGLSSSRSFFLLLGFDVLKVKVICSGAVKEDLTGNEFDFIIFL